MGPVNCLQSSIIKSVDINFNDKLVSQNEPNYAYVGFLENWAQPDNIKTSRSTLNMYYEDPYGDKDDVLNQADPTSADDANAALKKRSEYFKNSQIVHFFGKIYDAVHNSDKVLPPHIKIEYQFRLNPVKFFTMSASDNYDFIITDASISVKRITVNPSFNEALYSEITTNSLKYPVQYISTRTQSVGVGQWNAKFENAFTGNMPKSVIVAFIETENMVGTITKNPFVFTDPGLEVNIIFCYN